MPPTFYSLLTSTSNYPPPKNNLCTEDLYK